MQSKILGSIDTFQFSQVDWQKLVDYISILINIDRQAIKNSMARAGEHREKS